jgi:hypothetical protein
LDIVDEVVVDWGKGEEGKKPVSIEIGWGQGYFKASFGWYHL